MQNRDSSFEKRVALTIIVLFINLVFISNSVVLENNRSLLGTILYSIISPFHIVWNKSVDFVSDKIDRYVFIANNQKKIIELKKKNRELWYKNYKLRRKLNKLTPIPYTFPKDKLYISVNVISINSGFPLSGAIVDKGFTSGVHKGMIVLNQKMELVGKITEPVTFFSSKVQFITNPAGGIGAYLDSNKLEGLLKGDNSEICRFEYVIGNRKVDIGETVVTSGTDKIYPPYLKIGKVIRTEMKPLVMKIYVKPFFINSSIKRLILMNEK